MSGVSASGRTGTETAVLRAWAELLSSQPVSPGDDFFDLGGQSLQLVHFLQFVHDRFGIELEVVELFQAGFTAANTAVAIDRAVAGRGARSATVLPWVTGPERQSPTVLAEAE